MNVLPDLWLKARGNVILLSRKPREGYFAAYEQPNIIVRHLKATLEGGVWGGVKAYECVNGLDGYVKST